MSSKAGRMDIKWNGPSSYKWCSYKNMMEWARHLKRQQGMFRWIDEMNGPANKMSFLKDMFEKVVLIQKSRLTYILLAFNLLIYHHWAGRRFRGRYFPTNPALEWNVVPLTAKSKKLIGDSWRVCFSLIKELGEGECLHQGLKFITFRSSDGRSWRGWIHFCCHQRTQHGGESQRIDQGKKGDISFVR